MKKQAQLGAGSYGQGGYYGALSPNQIGGLLGARTLRGVQSPFANTVGGLFSMLQSTAASKGISAKSHAELAQKLGLSPRVARLVNSFEKGNVNQAALNAVSPQGMGRLIRELMPLGLSKQQIGSRLTTPGVEGQGMFMQHGGTQAILGAQHAYLNQRIVQPAVRRMLAQSGQDPKKAGQMMDAFLGFKGRGVRSPQEAEFLARRMGLPRGSGNQMYQVVGTALDNPRLRMVTGGGMHSYMDLANAHRQSKPMLGKARQIEDVVNPMVEKHRLNMPWQARAMEDFASPGGPKGFKNIARSILGVVPFNELKGTAGQIQNIMRPQTGMSAQQPIPGPAAPAAPQVTGQPGGWRSVLRRTQGVQQAPSSRGGFELPEPMTA